MGDAVFTVLFAVLGLIIAAIPAVRLVGMAIEGQLDAGPVIIALFLYIVLIAAVASGPGPIKVGALALIVLSAVMLPLAGKVQADRDLARIDDERLRAYADALERNPDDPVARIALAEELAKRGDIQQAIEHMEWTLQTYPKLSRQHQATLQAWKRQVAEQATEMPVICHVCHAEQPPGATQCSQCGAQFGAVAEVRRRIIIEGGPKTILRGWIIGVPLFILGSFVLLELPAIVAGPIILGAVAVGAFLFLRWVGGDIGRPMD